MFSVGADAQRTSRVSVARGFVAVGPEQRAEHVSLNEDSSPSVVIVASRVVDNVQLSLGFNFY